MASKWTSAQNKLITVQVVMADGSTSCLNIKRVMMDYVDMVLANKTEEEIKLALNVNAYDVSGWEGQYPTFRNYMQMRVDAKGWANTLNSDFVYGQLGKAATGQMTLNQAQISALKLIMQAKGMINANHKQLKGKSKIEEFTIAESTEAVDQNEQPKEDSEDNDTD